MSKDDHACPQCQSKALRRLYRLIDPRHHTASCRQCDFVFMHPYPSDEFLNAHYKARELYNSDQDSQSYERAIEDRALLMAGLLKRAQITEFKGASVDFGAGVGIAVAAQKKLGFEAIGIETNPQAQATGLEKFGVEIKDQALSDLPQDLSLFSLFEVLEHIKYPSDFLSEVRPHLRPGGVLLGSVPNYHGLARFLKGKHSIALAWPEHVNQFTRQSLSKTLSQAGFQPLYIGFPPPYGVVINLGLRRGLRRLLPQGGLSTKLIDLITRLKKNLIYPLPNALAEQTGWLGHGLVFIALKPKT